MTYSLTERKRIRKSFAKRSTVQTVPFLIATQLESYTAFLQAHVAPESRRNEGLQAAFRTLGRQHRIRENTVHALSGETIDADRGRCELACRTITESSYGAPALTRWVFDVRLDEASGRWLVQRVVFESLGGRPADSGILR